MREKRTTIVVEENLLKEAKRAALEQDKPLKMVISEALERSLAGAKEKKVKKKINIRVYDMGEIKGTLSRDEIYDWI